MSSIATRFRTSMIGCLVSLALGAPASAAEISHEALEKDGSLRNIEFIYITGEIKPGDDDKFRNISVAYPKAIVALDSEGGSLRPALEIGKMIHLREYYTMVGDDSTCTSACALIWIAGAERYMSSTGRVGFHASYRSNGGQKEETGLGNALVGRYLGLLSLPEKAVVFATMAAPDQIQWLTNANKGQAGIDFSPIGSSSSPPPLVRTQAAPAQTFASSGDTSGWTRVAGTDTVTYYMMRSQIFPVGSYRAAWTLVDHTRDPGVSYFSSKDLWYYDCRGRRNALKKYLNYDKQGKITGSGELDEQEMQWSSIVPGSVGETRMEVVCN